MIKKESFLAPNFASRGDYRCYLILTDNLRVIAKYASPNREGPLNTRDREYPNCSVWVIDSDYAMTREIINIETGEYLSYIM